MTDSTDFTNPSTDSSGALTGAAGGATSAGPGSGDGAPSDRTAGYRPGYRPADWHTDAGEREQREEVLVADAETDSPERATGAADAADTASDSREATDISTATSDAPSAQTSEESLDDGPARTEEEARRFAAEHDPAKHDIAAGEEFRQRGDWTAEAAGGPQVWDAEGHLVEGSSPVVDGDRSGVIGVGDVQRSAQSAVTSESAPQDQQDQQTFTDDAEAVQLSPSSTGVPQGAGATPPPSTGGQPSGDFDLEAGSDDTAGSPMADGSAPQDDAQHDSQAGFSSIDEVRDGGYGIGSAAPIEGGATPLGHPVKAWNDTRTYAEPGHPAYDAEPHVWFMDRQAAENQGFRQAD